MKKYFKIMLPLLVMFLLSDTHAQTKKVTSKKSTAKNKVTLKVVERNFGSPSTVSDVTDVTVADPAYGSIKNLIENHGVVVSYADSSFRAKEILKRGDFIVALNSALSSLKTKMDAAGVVDTTLFNTYDRNRGGAYLTTISQVKDVSENSIYYPAARSLIEQWGIAAPFALNKTLSANSLMPEKEVYDILRVTLGYNSAGANPYSAGMSRSKFAMVLNNAVSQKMTEINTLGTVVRLQREAEMKRQLDSLQKIETLRKDSVAKEIKLRKEEAARQEEEAKKALDKKKRR